MKISCIGACIGACIGECRILFTMVKRIILVDERYFKVEAVCWLWYDFS